MKWQWLIANNLALVAVCSAPAHAQTVSPGTAAATAPVSSAPFDLSKTFIAQLEERVTTLEERVLGLEHPTDSLVQRVEELEKESFGGVSQDQLSLPDRIAHLESAVYSRPQAKNLPDGMESFVEDKHARAANPLKLRMPNLKLSQFASSKSNQQTGLTSNLAATGGFGATIVKSVPAPNTHDVPTPINPYATPGAYYGYPYVYNGPGLPPYAYGVFPGSPGWFDSAYRQSGQTFYIGQPFFPWAANRIAPHSNSNNAANEAALQALQMQMMARAAAAGKH
jgi:hypothetical protein